VRVSFYLPTLAQSSGLEYHTHQSAWFVAGIVFSGLRFYVAGFDERCLLVAGGRELEPEAALRGWRPPSANVGLTMEASCRESGACPISRCFNMRFPMWASIFHLYLSISLELEGLHHMSHSTVFGPPHCKAFKLFFLDLHLPSSFQHSRCFDQIYVNQWHQSSVLSKLRRNLLELTSDPLQWSWSGQS